MNYDELNEIVAKEAGVSICPICGIPFTKYHSRQVTCASSECKKAHRAIYLKKRTERLQEEDIDLFRQKRNEAQKRYRRKQKKLKTADDNLKKAQDYWARREQSLQTESPDGRGYAEEQIRKTLSQVPKIDVKLERRNKDDNVHHQDDAE